MPPTPCTIHFGTPVVPDENIIYKGSLKDTGSNTISTPSKSSNILSNIVTSGTPENEDDLSTNLTITVLSRVGRFLIICSFLAIQSCVLEL